MAPPSPGPARHYPGSPAPGLYLSPSGPSRRRRQSEYPATQKTAHGHHRRAYSQSPKREQYRDLEGCTDDLIKVHAQLQVPKSNAGKEAVVKTRTAEVARQKWLVRDLVGQLQTLRQRVCELEGALEAKQADQSEQENRRCAIRVVMVRIPLYTVLSIIQWWTLPLCNTVEPVLVSLLCIVLNTFS